MDDTVFVATRRNNAPDSGSVATCPAAHSDQAKTAMNIIVAGSGVAVTLSPLVRGRQGHQF
jgi:hypothetical protein